MELQPLLAVPSQLPSPPNVGFIQPVWESWNRQAGEMKTEESEWCYRILLASGRIANGSLPLKHGKPLFCGVLQQLSFWLTSIFISLFKPRDGEAHSQPFLALGSLLFCTESLKLTAPLQVASFLHSFELIFFFLLTDSLRLFKVVHRCIDHRSAKYTVSEVQGKGGSLSSLYKKQIARTVW